MDMQSFEAQEAEKLVDLLVNQIEREPGLGDLAFRIQTKFGEEQVGLIVERNGESSQGGVLLNDGGEPIRYEDMVWIGVGFAV